MIKDGFPGCFLSRFIDHLHQSVWFEETVAPLIVAMIRLHSGGIRDSLPGFADDGSPECLSLDYIGKGEALPDPGHRSADRRPRVTLPS
jgi:hypothetical protein